MSLEMQRGRFTYEDLCRLPEDDLRHEIIHGEHLMTPSPRVRHQILVTRILHGLTDCLGADSTGLVLAGPCDVLLAGGHVLVPDLVFVSPERLSRVTELNIQGAPDLVVEVLSPSTRGRDLGVKRTLYEASGTREYWIVDPDSETVLLCRAGVPAGFASPEEFRKDRRDTLTSPLFPRLALPLARLFS